MNAPMKWPDRSPPQSKDSARMISAAKEECRGTGTPQLIWAEVLPSSALLRLRDVLLPLAPLRSFRFDLRFEHAESRDDLLDDDPGRSAIEVHAHEIRIRDIESTIFHMDMSNSPTK